VCESLMCKHEVVTATGFVDAEFVTNLRGQTMVAHQLGCSPIKLLTNRN
jgi:hypothetical protein